MMIYYCCLLLLLQLVCGTLANAQCTPPNPHTADFGISDASNDLGPLQLSGIAITCDTEYRLGLDGGQHLEGTRHLSDGAGNFISYYLWSDSGGSTEWGSSGLSGTLYPAEPLTASGNGTEVTHTVYATAITAGASPPGIYTDQVQVILAYPPYGPDDTLTADLFITLSLSGTCSLNTDELNDFGSWLPDTNIYGIALGAVTVICSPGLDYKIGMGAGQNYRNGSRNMHYNGYLVPYSLWADNARTISWGDQGLSTMEPDYTETYPAPALSETGTGDTQSFFIWGDAIIKGKRPGTYIDTVTVTVVWQ